MISLQVSAEFSDFRLDKFLCKEFDISFALAQKLVRQKKVKVNQQRAEISQRLCENDIVEIFSDLPKRRENSAKKKPKISEQKLKKFESWKIFENENLLAINKPSGIAVQGGSGIEFCVDDVLSHLNLERSAQEKLQLVHRLDKDTSGVLLIAKNHQAAEILTDSFRKKTIQKTYLALVYGIVKKEEGTIEIPLRKKFQGKNEKVMPDFDEGKEAITHFKLLKIFKKHDPEKAYSLLELKPVTGRTHQLRVHCKEIGHPILNDIKYGGKKVERKDVSNRMCLHAQKIFLKDFFGKEVEIEVNVKFS